MARVAIAPGMATFGIGALTLFAGGGLLIGALMLIGAENVARQGASSPLQIRIGAGVVSGVSLVVLIGALRQWRAIAAIVVDRAAWTLVDRLGRATAVPPGAAVEVMLRCRRVIYSWGGPVRIQDVVDGTLTVDGRHHRLAPSGAVTYARVLGALGASGAPPARGHATTYTVRAG